MPQLFRHKQVCFAKSSSDVDFDKKVKHSEAESSCALCKIWERFNCGGLLPLLIFWLAVVASLVIIWWISGAEMQSLGGRLWLTVLIRLTGDASLLTALFVIISSRRSRWIVLIPLYIVSLWALISVWYYRFWGDLPGLNSLLLTVNVGLELMASVLALWRPGDIIFLLIPALITLLYIFGVKRNKKHVFLTIRDKGIIISTGLLLFLAGQVFCSWSVMKFQKSIGKDSDMLVATKSRLTDSIIINNRDMAKNGPLVHFAKSLYETIGLLTIKKELTIDDRKLIERFISLTPVSTSLPDSVVNANAKKNIIIILVESLNSSVVEKVVDGVEIAPVMHGLLNREGTLWLPNVITQVRSGGSGDGQLIINTGLYPLSAFSTSVILGSDNLFPGLPRALGRKDNIVVLGDDGKSWNEKTTFQNFGFDRILTRAEYTQLIKNEGGDGGMFRYAMQLIPELRAPFLLELLTVSMHVPFHDSDIPPAKINHRIRESSTISATERDYLRMVNYFDSELGVFLEFLSSSGILEKSMVFIISDHSQELGTSTGANQIDTPMMMMGINCGITGKIERTLGQIDIYPTILHLSGARGPGGWMGAGRTALDAQYHGVYTPQHIISAMDSADEKRLKESVEISELILRTDYFRH